MLSWAKAGFAVKINHKQARLKIKIQLSKRSNSFGVIFKVGDRMEITKVRENQLPINL